MAGLITYNGKLLRRGNSLADSVYCCCNAVAEVCEECSIVIRGGTFSNDGVYLNFLWAGVATIRLTMPVAGSRLVRETESVAFRIHFFDYAYVTIVRTGPAWVSEITVGQPEAWRYRRGIDDLSMYSELRETDDNYPDVEAEEDLIIEGNLTYDAHYHFTDKRNGFGYAWIFIDYCFGDEKGTYEIEAYHCEQSDLDDFCYKWAPECTDCCYIFHDESQETDDLKDVDESDPGLPITASVIVPVDTRVVDNDESSLATATALYGVSASRHALITTRLNKAKVCIGEETEYGIETEDLTLEIKLVGPPTEVSGTVVVTGWYFREQPGATPTYDADGFITHLTWTAINTGDFMSVACSPYFFLCRKDPETDELIPDGEPPSELLVTWTPGTNCILEVPSDEFNLQYSQSELHICDRTACCEFSPCCCDVSKVRFAGAATFYWNAGSNGGSTCEEEIWNFDEEITIPDAWDCELIETTSQTRASGAVTINHPTTHTAVGSNCDGQPIAQLQFSANAVCEIVEGVRQTRVTVSIVLMVCTASNTPTYTTVGNITKIVNHPACTALYTENPVLMSGNNNPNISCAPDAPYTIDYTWRVIR